LALGHSSESFGSDVEAEGIDAKILIFGGGTRRPECFGLAVIQDLYSPLPSQSLHPLVLLYI
jgi:hypothetical protein